MTFTIANTAWKRLCVALSIANLVMFRIWLVTPPHLGPEDSGLLSNPYPPVHYLALTLNTLLLAAGIWAWLHWTASAKSSLRRVVFVLGTLVLLGLVANSARTFLSAMFPTVAIFRWDLSTWRQPIPATVLLMASALIAFAFVRLQALRAVFANLIVLLALPAVVNIATAGYMIASYRAPVVHPPSATSQAQEPRTARLLIAVFDEWDQRLTFEKRYRQVMLPEIDQFRSQSVQATQAIRGGPRTRLSLASMITGDPVHSVEIAGPDEFLLRREGRTDRWQNVPTLFSEAQKAGARTAIVGWYLPYCRMFGAFTTACADWPYYLFSLSRETTLLGAVVSQARLLTDVGTHSLWEETLESEWTRRNRTALLKESCRIAADPAYDLIFLHLPMTHVPFFFDPKTKSWVERQDLPDGYASGLAYADYAIGEMRRAMQASGQWDRTTVLLTGDHQLRFPLDSQQQKERRVPLLIRMPGQNREYLVNGPVQMTILKDLGLAILNGEVKSPEQLASKLAEPHGSTQEAAAVRTVTRDSKR